MSTTIDRRQFLKGLLGGAVVSIALPPLEAMMNTTGTAWADGSAFPTRFGLWTWANGTVPERFTPVGVGAGDAWALSDALQPLAALKHRIAVVSGLEVKAQNTIPHYSGFGAFLTGLEQIGEEGAHTYAGPTLDQRIAAEIGGFTVYRSIETAAHSDEAVSYNGPYSPNPPETSPHALFERLFGPSFREPGDDAAIDPKLALRRSVLDVVTGRIDELQKKLGQADKERLDQHLTGIRDLETRLARLEEGPPDLAACSRAAEPEADGAYVTPMDRHRAMTDLLVMALACDQTRVVTHTFIQPVGNYQFPGTTEGHHQLTHNEPGDQPTVQQNTVTAITEYAYFLDKLEAVTEGESTLLDHCAILGTSDVSLGRTHAIDEWPAVIGGSANGALLNDVHVRSTTRENASKLPLTLMRAMGISQPSYGDEDRYTEDGIGGIES